MIEELTDEQAEEEKKKIEEEKQRKLQEQKEEEEAELNRKEIMEKSGPIDMSHMEEKEEKVAEEDEGTRRILEGFNHLKVKIHFLSDDVKKIFKKQKYQNLFDVGVVSLSAFEFIHEEGAENIFKPSSHVYVENCNTCVAVKKDLKAEFREGLQKKMEEKGLWKMKYPSPYHHHQLFVSGKE